VVLAAVGVLPAGCSEQKSTTQPMTVRDRQDVILKDPFGYKPDQQYQDVSGGKTSELNRDALKRDLNHVLNP
jgi:DNA invertase Pin-like site-specific DNA recombinase